MILFADVAFPRPLLRRYTYSVPGVWAAAARPGVRVRASLGRQTAVGVIVRVHDNPPAEAAEIKEIAAVLDDAPVLLPAVMRFTRDLALDQATSWGALLGLALPPDPAPPFKRRPARREPEKDDAGQLELDLETTAAVSAAAAEIGRAIETGAPADLLAWGGAGARRALLLEAARAALEKGRSVLVLFPDLARIGDLRDRLRAGLGTEPALFHGRLSPRAQWTAWDRAVKKDARIILGSRAALFKPWPDIGLILVEDESEETHFQTESPAYDVRRGARLRAAAENSVLLSSAGAPTVGAYALARAVGSLRPLGGEDPVPDVVIAGESDADGVLSRPMSEGLAATLAAGGRSAVFLNRRGYASLLFCPRCGFIPRCGTCGFVLPYHKKIDRLVCHTCGTEEPRPAACPSCGRPVLEPRGGGVEALEEELKSAFPRARIAVFDRDRAGRIVERRKILEAWSGGKLDILIGTQLLARVPDFPAADFVGIFNPEAALAFPEFTASERTFQLLVRMIRFVRPGGRRPAAVIQTGFPDHHAIRTAARLDFEAFFTEEIELRRLLGQPPFVSLADVVLRGRDARRLGQEARLLAAAWRKSRAKMDVLGPSFVSDAGRPGMRRVQIQLRAETPAVLSGVLAAGLKNAGLPFTVVRHDGLTR